MENFRRLISLLKINFPAVLRVICTVLLFFPVTENALIFGAENFSITLGGKNGWENILSSEGLTKTEGRFSWPALGIAPAGEVTGQNSEELYISFDTPDFRDSTGNYRVLSSTIQFSAPGLVRQGTGAALCNTSGEGLSLRGNAGAFFSERGELPSFTISFWLYPAVTETGGTVFSWRSSVMPEDINGNSPLYQTIRAAFEKNRLVWEFSDMWITSSGAALKARLEPSRMIVPRKWSFHQVSYDSITGLLEYRVDGLTEAVTYITENRLPSGSPVTGLIGNPSDIDIASQYSGLIDELRINREPLPEVNIDTLRTLSGYYPATGGKFVTAPVDTGQGKSIFLSADISLIEPEGTGSEFYIRSGDNFYTWTEDYPQWIPIIDGKPSGKVSGRYFQISGGLYPDSSRQETPVLTWISLNFERENAPWPPLNVRGYEGNKTVKLSWNAPADSDIKGYLVYYGEGSGEYLSPASPIDAGNSLSCVIQGLENGKMYYFCVASYGAAGKDFPGPCSPEICLRPLAIKNDIEGVNLK